MNESQAFGADIIVDQPPRSRAPEGKRFSIEGRDREGRYVTILMAAPDMTVDAVNRLILAFRDESCWEYVYATLRCDPDLDGTGYHDFSAASGTSIDVR